MSGGYTTASTLREHAGTSRLALATALGVTPDGVVNNPMFFSGFPDRPDVLAAGLLAVADVAGSRYADVGLSQRVASLDPVVTAGGDILRFESFSTCNGVHARLDVLAEGLATSTVGFGTTNVDINPPLRAALARTSRTEALHLSVGHGGLTASTPGASHVERKVSLPDRWVRGLAEVPTISASMSHRGTVRGPAIRKLLGALPRVAPPGPFLHLVPAPGSWRIATHGSERSIPLPGATRLRGSERVTRYARQLDVYSSPTGTTAWVFELPSSRLTLVLSPEPYRAFSGEGGLLMWLKDPSAETCGLELLPHLGWGHIIDPGRLADVSGMSPSEVTTSLAWLAASGRLGYDLSANAWFHRALPVDVAAVLRRNPRLLSAQRLLEQDKVSQIEPGTWLVARSSNATYQVRADRAAGKPSEALEFSRPTLVCRCPWEEKHHGTRGPCKHVLAVAMSLRGVAAE
ncbi:SWIM zinc finger family protein [Nocardioides sambongensis]|uniref:SWIM zinc finger family protein n=1 Tax=Nocardioides sambongensis TaxID=2589074 RepID=UPI00112C3250|nr:SWIM zinc finger family protein [Nocardioides sambongensis]